MAYILRIKETRIGEMEFRDRQAADEWLSSIRQQQTTLPVAPFHVNRVHWQEQEIVSIGFTEGP